MSAPSLLVTLEFVRIKRRSRGGSDVLVCSIFDLLIYLIFLCDVAVSCFIRRMVFSVVASLETLEGILSFSLNVWYLLVKTRQKLVHSRICDLIEAILSQLT